MFRKAAANGLVLRTLLGYLHEESNNAQNVLLRPVPKSDKDVAVETYLESEPKVELARGSTPPRPRRAFSRSPRVRGG
jgi:hypothetical protein